MTRLALHAATLGQFDCEQRVATLLVELALHTGVNSPGGVVAFDLPFNRKDIADYLGLNPDTLSRIMSRLKTAGLIGHSKRNRAVVRDFPALASRSPAARSLIEISGARRGRSIAAHVRLTGRASAYSTASSSPSPPFSSEICSTETTRSPSAVENTITP